MNRFDMNRLDMDNRSGMDDLDPAAIEKLLLLSTNFDTLHRALPDMLFPGDDPQAQKLAREKQLEAILAWRESLAAEEERLMDEED